MQNQRFRTYLKRAVYSLVTLSLLLFTPSSYIFAESAAPSTSSGNTSCSPVAPAPAGITSPTGSDAGTYTYNSCTGLWENAYYTWSPATQMATPKTPYVYACDTATWRWVTNVWIYSPAAGKYLQVPTSRATLPAGATVAADSLNPCAPPPPASTGSSSTAPDNNTTGSPTTSSGGNSTAATMQNGVTSGATSGNAAVTQNLNGGSAASGNATVVANVLNALNSSSALNGGNVVTFTANVNGNVQGDLIVDPNMLQPASTSDPLSNPNLTVNNQTNGQINNNIKLAAATGDATVAQNTTAGDATTGTASAIANVVNMLNSIVSAGKSFVGVVNINGDMQGNILVPQNFIDSLIASNTPSTTVSLTPDQAQSIGMTNAANLATTNNVTNTATSGAANVTNNTNAGNATTGATSTKVTIFNLTGNQVVGANCLLVFVNVSGTWVGVIMNAPQGATAAALGSGLSQNTLAPTATLANSTNGSITNNIDVNAHSGDATVDSNTNAGNARSGNANTAVNLLNMNNANLALTGWFGILFINIFGNWYGNFGIYTPPVAPASTNTGSAPSQPTGQPAKHKMFQFVQPHVATASQSDTTADTPLPSIAAQLAAQTGSVLGASTNSNRTNSAHNAKVNYSSQMIGGILVVVGLSTLGAERLISKRKVHHA